MVWLMAGEGEFEPEDWAGNINLYVDGANRVEAVPGLTEDLIHLEEGTIQEFFSSDQLECVVNQQTCEERGWKVGDEISLNFFYFMADNATMTLSCYTNPLELARVKIVGTMEDLTTATGAVSPDVVLPLETVRSMFDRNGVSFMADTLSFQVSDPLRLNEFKEEMKGLGFMEREAGSMDSYSGIALAVDDSSFLSMARNLQFAMDTMTAFLPAVLALAALVGYVVSSLLAGKQVGRIRAPAADGNREVQKQHRLLGGTGSAGFGWYSGGRSACRYRISGNKPLSCLRTECFSGHICWEQRRPIGAWAGDR